jgi:hypothetical protein
VRARLACVYPYNVRSGRVRVTRRIRKINYGQSCSDGTLRNDIVDVCARAWGGVARTPWYRSINDSSDDQRACLSRYVLIVLTCYMLHVAPRLVPVSYPVCVYNANPELGPPFKGWFQDDCLSRYRPRYKHETPSTPAYTPVVRVRTVYPIVRIYAYDNAKRVMFCFLQTVHFSCTHFVVRFLTTGRSRSVL